MMSPSSLTLVALLQAACTVALPARRATSPYAPVQATCPAEQLVRQANGISNAEATYIGQRYQKASTALETWLNNIDAGFSASKEKRQWEQWQPQGGKGKAPVIALASSGGGYRAQLAGAGVVKGFDSREADQTKISGLYQAATYHSGLSGGSWLLSSIAGNDYPTISTLQTLLYEPVLSTNPLVPPILVSQQAAPIYNAIASDIQAKIAAGFEPSIIDSWGRLLSYGLLAGTDGGVATTLSSIASSSNFTSFMAPYPIITALGSDLDINGVCIPQPNATQYEFHPYEFGSWDAGVDAFVVSEYLGTNFSAGKPTGRCVTHYDQLGYVLGTSSNVFASACEAIPANKTAAVTDISLVENLAALIAPGAPGVPEKALFGLYRNPFQNFEPSSHIANQEELLLVDGGVSIDAQVNPIWPFLHREVDVIIVNDNSADLPDNFPNGTSLYDTYQAASKAGLSKMPVIPPVETIVAKGFNQKPTFFGCNSVDTATVVYLPNFNFTYQSGTLTSQLLYNVTETRGMISNGVETANFGGKADWPLCLACGIMKKSGESLADGCDACFQEYCFN